MVITPARQQYLRLKAEHPDAILLYRMGDFYEMFDEDAHTAARVLGITLTSREFGRSGRVPMAGIPYHALNGYLRRFLRAGYRLAICEQLLRARAWTRGARRYPSPLARHNRRPSASR